MNTQEIELSIISQVLDDALCVGYCIDVNDGEDIVLERSKSKDAILAAMRSTECDRLYFNIGSERIGWVDFIYGNGRDVIHDWTENLTAVLSDACELADSFD